MTDTDAGRQRIHDPRVLRAIAHPVRNRILTELTASGPMRAADVARELDIPANQASFHLRQLAKYGLVEEDPQAARDRRDRVWKAVTEHGMTIELKDIEDSPDGRAAASVFLRSRLVRAHQLMEVAHGDDRPPDSHRSIAEQAVRLTKDEARELSEELQELADRWVARTRGRDDGRSTYVLFQVLMPYPEELG